jgi:chaperone protein EcpD
MPPEHADAQLRWSIVREGTRASLRVQNPSPYVVSFNTVEIVAGEGTEAPSWTLGGGMVVPGESSLFALPALARADDVTGVRFATINDFGAVVPRTAVLRR